ncbi:transcriptional repressor general negative regulator of transcription subunit 4 [Microbotryomycetes sp. JL221]|nr:transcriptional repressor general negative regulator of transcription subunit 4 [Microbotryomycetes sp. JL221]
MDVSDLNFKPCPCGYQICRFCYSHIKDELNNRCPACRQPYDDATVEFKPIKPEELKRVQAAQKLRDKRRKEEQTAFQTKANVRVRQRTQVQVQGMTTKIANEDTVAQLKGSEHFGQYGRVLRLVMSKRTGVVTGHSHPLYSPVNVFVSYRTAHEASNCINSIDGTTTEDGHKLRATWATTRYCPTFLRGGKCHNESCLNAHEYGEEVDSNGSLGKDDNFFNGDSETQRTKTGPVVGRKIDVTLPATASWASKDGKPMPPVSPIVINASMPPLSASIKPPPPPQQPKQTITKPPAQPLPVKPSSQSRLTKAEAKAAVNAAAGISIETSGNLQSRTTSVDDINVDQTEIGPHTESEAMEQVEMDTTPVASTSQASSGASIANLTHPPSNDMFEQSRLASTTVDDTFPSIGFGFDEGFSFSFDLPSNVGSKGKSKASFASLDGTSKLSTTKDDQPVPTVNLGPGSHRESPETPSTSLSGPNGSDPMAALFPTPLAPSYHGSFDPFAEASSSSADAFSNGVFGETRSGSPSPPTSSSGLGTADERRGSRFGFARRGSSNMSTLRAGDLSQAMMRGAFSSSSTGSSGGRQSPRNVQSSSTMFAPPGIGTPTGHQQQPSQPQQRPGSSNNINSSQALFALLSGGAITPNDNGPEAHLSTGMWSSSQAPPPSSSSSSFGMTTTSNNAPLPNFPPGILRAFSSPQTSAASSPQLSPRARSNLPLNSSTELLGSGGPPGLVNGSHTASGMTRIASGGGAGGAGGGGLPPGLGLNHHHQPQQHHQQHHHPHHRLGAGQTSSASTATTTIPTASFPLPPPAPGKTLSPSAAGTVVGKDDLLALIAKAQQSSKNQVQQPDSHPFFSDPAILNARLASAVSPNVSNSSPSPALQALQQQFSQLSHVGNGGGGGGTSSTGIGMNSISNVGINVGSGSAFHSLDSLSSPPLNPQSGSVTNNGFRPFGSLEQASQQHHHQQSQQQQQMFGNNMNQQVTGPVATGGGYNYPPGMLRSPFGTGGPPPMGPQGLVGRRM